MAIKSLCSKNAVSIDKNATLEAAARLMREKNIGSLIVTDPDRKHEAIGILTDRDLALQGFADGQSGHTPVHRLMSKQVISIDGQDGIAEAVERMERSGVRRILVKDENQQVCGVVSSDDILQLLARELHALGKIVEKQGALSTAFSSSR
jgi:signal-transduction protein with cAMP-binding, CBS, and nucleotidyltransferase domain